MISNNSGYLYFCFSEKDAANLSDHHSSSVGGTTFCSVCTEVSKTIKDVGTRNRFVTGCTSLKLESIKLHQESLNHKKAEKVIAGKLKPTSTPAFEIVCSLNKEVLEKLQKMFKNCHALAMNHRPYSDYLWMCDLDECKGLSLGKTYRNIEAAKSFTSAIAKVELQKYLQIAKDVKFLSVLSDGSTNSSVSEQEMFFLRTVKHGEINMFFIAVIQVEKANSAGIRAAMERAVVDYLGMPWTEFTSKLCSLGCDGASVMLGKKSGLYALLRQEQPCIIPLHCFAHRLELAFKDSVKKLKLYEKSIETLCMGLYYFYHRSSLNRSLLRRAYDALKMKPLMPTRVGGTRWVGHIHRALINITVGYSALKLHLQQVHCSFE